MLFKFLAAFYNRIVLKFIFRIAFVLISNIVALYLASLYITGFSISTDLVSLLTVAALFTLIHFIVKPFLKLLFGPLVLITFGLVGIAINAGLLYLLDFLSQDVRITGIQSLIYATLFITAVNVVLGFVGKFLRR